MKWRIGRWVAAAIISAGAVAAWAWPPEPAFDPRPLSEKLEKKLASEQGGKVTKFSFVIFGDTKHARDFPKVVALAQSLKPDFALLTGDMVATGATQLYDDLEHTLGPFMRTCPTWPTVGNHELGRVEGWGMYKQFFNIHV